ncbi:fatty acyl-CoA hydrolase precursor, medium chain-like [Crassostrea angulata]|uniref:fatty acyl-CoA hydrolase precursor, medium chain-like n=1 Tax=Magallana angulata TaxID=2784310 RepID=UPI0022B13AD2|nr:fatty acyl-CoA hydrolase precursor, medium chain-like [Crassostrea angulata]
MSLPYFIAILLNLAVLQVTGGQNFEILTRLGKVNGVIHPSPGGNVYRFAGIPFGKSPTGSRRFRKPQAYGSWNETLDATKFGPHCIQSLKSQVSKYVSEDCLQLNIYVPSNMTKEVKRSVMVFIHGGGYMAGSAIDEDGSKFASFGNVIFVTINYRLGIFGFPSMQNPNVDENVGIWDQILALKWIKNNIDDYGGNSSDVTIFGQSAGSFSVNLLMMIPRNKGLFHRAILQSGTANSLVAFKRSSDLGRRIGMNAGCRDQDPHTFIQCLQNLDAGSLVNSTLNYSSTLGINVLTEIVFVPVLDNDLFQRTPIEIMHDKFSAEFQFFESIDMIVGNCNEEGGYIAQYAIFFEKQYNFSVVDGIPRRFLCDGVIPSMVELYYKNNSSISDLICEEYSSNDKTTQSLNAAHLLSDFVFISSAVSALQAHSFNQKSSTYQYIFSEDIRPFYTNMPKWYHGAVHGTELAFMFVAKDMYPTNFTLSQDQMKFARDIINYWTNFAKTGNPNGPGLSEWRPFTPSLQFFKQLSMTNTTNGKDYRKEQVKMWNTLNDFEYTLSSAPFQQIKTIWFVVVLCCIMKLYS